MKQFTHVYKNLLDKMKIRNKYHYKTRMFPEIIGTII